MMFYSITSIVITECLLCITTTINSTIGDFQLTHIQRNKTFGHGKIITHYFYYNSKTHTDLFLTYQTGTLLSSWTFQINLFAPLIRLREGCLGRQQFFATR